MKVLIAIGLALLALLALWNWSVTPDECKDGLYIKTTTECRMYNLIDTP